MRLVRTEYWNPSTDTVRTGNTGHGESLADMETYLLPLTTTLLGEALGSGVAHGLEVVATAGQQGLTVNTGLAVDGTGRPIVLSDDGAAVIDPNAPPGVQNVPLVLVGSGGIELPTSGPAGPQVLTITAREALDGTAGAASWSLVHAPWLQLVPQATFTDDGTRVPLALVTLDTTGAVTALDAGPRRQVSPAVGGLTFRRTTATGGQTPSVGAAAGPSLQSRQDGGLDVLLPGSPAGAALSVEGATGHVGIAAGSGALAAALQVGGGVHTGGADGGFSFMDQQVPGYVDAPTAGERWRWYADAGYARLWSGTDQLSVGQPGDGGGLDVPRRMRVRQGADDSAGIWLWQNDTPQAAFVGMSDSSHVGLWGLGVGWGLTMDVASGALSTQGDLAVHGSVVVDANLSAGGTVDSFQYTTNGQSWLRGQVYTGGLFGHWDGVATMRLFGSALYDLGDNWLQIQSGGGRTYMRGDVTVEGSSWLKGQVYTGPIFGHWDGNATMWLFGSSLYDQGDGWLQLQSGGGKTYMRGEVTVQGALHKAGGGFRIDHPLAPAEKYLSHSFVESPEMVNLYNGVAVTDGDGQAQVALPDYFEVLNSDHRFQLTTIGQLAMATVDGEVRDNAFTIRTDKPGVRVSWQVTGVRQDPWAEAHRIIVEEDKQGQEQGSFLHPELFGQQAEHAFLAAGSSEAGAISPAALRSPPAPPTSEPPRPEGATA